MLTAPADVLHPGEGADTIEPLVGEKSFMLRDEEEHLQGRKAILPAFHVQSCTSTLSWWLSGDGARSPHGRGTSPLRCIRVCAR